MVNYIFTPQNTGKTWQLTFNPDFTCSQTGTLLPVKDGIYTLSIDSLHIAFRSDSYITKFNYEYLSQDTLILDSGSPVDAPIFFFVRK